MQWLIMLNLESAFAESGDEEEADNIMNKVSSIQIVIYFNV